MKDHAPPFYAGEPEVHSRLLRLALEDFSGERELDDLVPLDSLPKFVAGYELIRELGRGGDGLVYLARQPNLQRLVALKVLRTRSFDDRTAQQRFQREAELVASLQHPQIIRIYESGIWENQPYYSMQYVEGKNLKEKIRDNVLSWQQAAEWTAILSDAIHFAHGRGLLHRDIKPQNILIDLDDRVHLADFGLARRIQETNGLTMTGMVVGTIQYMAPELLSGSGKEFSVASDVYALGSILYEMLTGIPPFAGNSLGEISDNIRHHEVVPPSRLRPSTPRSLELICLKCLRKRTAQRYADAGEVADALQLVLKEQGQQRNPIDATSPLYSKVSGVLLTMVVLLLVIGTVWRFFPWSHEVPQTLPPVVHGISPFIRPIDASTPGVIRIVPGDSHILPDQSFLTVGNFWTTTEDQWVCPSLTLNQTDPIWITLATPCIDFDLAMVFSATNDADLAAYSEKVPETSIFQDYVAMLGTKDNGLSLLRLFGRNGEITRQPLVFSGRHTMQLSRYKGWITVLLDTKPILVHPDERPSLTINRLFIWGGFAGDQQVFEILYRAKAPVK